MARLVMSNKRPALAEELDSYQTKPISVKDFLDEVRSVLDSDQVKAV